MIIGTVHSKSVGKTTLAVHMAAWLDLYGTSVTVVDADWQQQSSEWLNEAAPQIPTHVMQNPSELMSAIPQLAQRHDGVIVDGPAGLDETAGAVLAVSDVVMIPCGPNSAEIKALKMVAKEVREIQRLRKEREGNEAPFAFVIPVRTNPRWKATKILQTEAANLGFYEMPAYVPFRQIYASLSGMPGDTPKLLWQLGRSRQVKDAVMDLDKLFQGMFPEISESDPKLVARMMSKPIATIKRQLEPVEEEDEQHRLVANA